jgi:hypothetical protein
VADVLAVEIEPRRYGRGEVELKESRKPEQQKCEKTANDHDRNVG